jgi:hypothetical protein
MNLSGIVANGIGQPVRRKEDFRLLTGKSGFGDDVHPPETAHSVIVRSPHAHARIQSVDDLGPLRMPALSKDLDRRRIGRSAPEPVVAVVTIVGAGSTRNGPSPRQRQCRPMPLSDRAAGAMDRQILVEISHTSARPAWPNREDRARLERAVEALAGKQPDLL